MRVRNTTRLNKTLGNVNPKMRDNLQIYALGLDPNDVQNTELMKEIKQALERENTMVLVQTSSIYKLRDSSTSKLNKRTGDDARVKFGSLQL